MFSCILWALARMVTHPCPYQNLMLLGVFPPWPVPQGADHKGIDEGKTSWVTGSLPTIALMPNPEITHVSTPMPSATSVRHPP